MVTRFSVVSISLQQDYLLDSVIGLFTPRAKHFHYTEISLRNYACYVTRMNNRLLTYLDA